MSSSDPDKPAVKPIGALLGEITPLAGIREYEAAIDRVIGMALGRIRIFERRLSTEYNSAARAAAMRAFLLANPTNRIAIVVHDADRIRTDCPRLVSLQRQFANAVSIHRTLSLARHVYDPFCVADGSHYCRRFHYDGMRGSLALNDAEYAAELVRRFEEIWEVSQAAVTPTTLGL
jgi:hypothetical protein